VGRLQTAHGTRVTHSKFGPAIVQPHADERRL
jgi:hypothetical protein